MSAEKQHPASITFTPNAPALTFNDGDTKVWLTISPEGVMAVGAGLSEDEATQRVAHMLAQNYSALHRDQADRIATLEAALAAVAVAAYSEPYYLGRNGMEPGPDGLLQPGSPYDRGRYDARKAIEALAARAASGAI